MGSGSSKSEEIIVNQQSQQLQSPSAASTKVEGFGPSHLIALCVTLALLALVARFIWRLIVREIKLRTPRAPAVATIV